MKGIDSTGALLVHVPGWVGGWVEVKVVLSIAYSNQKCAWRKFWINFNFASFQKSDKKQKKVRVSCW
jgi:hypothetical protein